MSQRTLAPAKPRTLRPPPAPTRRTEVRAPDLELAETHDANGIRSLSVPAGAAAVVPPPAAPPSITSKRDFTQLDPRAPQNIADEDLARAIITRVLLDELAPRIGLDPSRITIHVDAQAEAAVNAAGASGLQEGTTILLHPRRYQPSAREGRYLLAHEAAHAAQRGVRGPVVSRDAEREATDLGQAFAERRVLRPVRRALGHRRAADTGADTGEETAPPSLEASTKLIAAAVATSRSREIVEIKKLLSGLWVSDGDVFDVMRILDTVSFVVANGIVRSLSEQERYWLADNINPPHVYKHRRSVLACYYNTLSEHRLRDAVDLKVFRALPAVGMSTEEIEAAADTLKHLSDDQRQELLSSSNGPAIKRIISAPKPSADELARSARDAAADAAREGELAKQRKAILAHKDDAAAKTLLDQVTRLLTTQQYGDRFQTPNQGMAIEALDILEASRAEETRFLYVAEQLEEAGLIDQLLDLLPADSYFDRPAHSATLIALVRSRLPYKNEKLIENLLSYGLFDWAIRDYEALFAYKLIKLLPLSQQYAFRQRDGGKWYLRLLENLPDDQRYPGLEIRVAESKRDLDEAKAKYKALKPEDKQGLAVEEVTENGETKLFFNASQLQEAKLEKDPTARKSLDDLIGDFREGKKDAPALYRELVLLGGSSLEPGKETPGDELLRETIVHELDRLGYIEKLFGDLDDKFLFAEENRISTVKIMLARDPARVQAHARELVSRNFTDWMVTDGEAYLAYMCVKALPADEREAFIRDNATEWGRIQSEMSESMRQSRDLNLYIGDKAGTDRGSVLGQLADPATWTGDNAALVGDLVRMAIAMTEHRFAFERSKEFRAVEKPKLAPLVDKYRLWDPRVRPVYKPDLLKGTRWYEEGIFSDLRTLWSGLVALWNLDVLFVQNKIGARVDLNDVQDFMGGDLGGAKLGDPKKRGKNATPPSPDANKLTLLVGTDSKSAELILPELLIDSANVQLASTTLQSGQVQLKGLHISAAYDQPDMAQPASAHVTLESVVANDLLLAKSSSMITVTRLAVNMLRLAAGTIDTVTRGSRGREKSVPFPLLVIPLLAMFILLALPIYLYKKIAALVDEGLESNTGEHFAADVATRTKAISFSFDSLDVDSITTSGGQHVGHVGVRDFAVRIGLNKATRLRAEQTSVNQRLRALAGNPQATAAIQQLRTRKAQLDAAENQVEQDEQEYLQIQKQILKGGLTKERQAALQKRLDALNFEDKGGAFIDVGSVEASGLSGNVTSKDPIRINNIHGEGGGAALTQMFALPTTTTTELSRRSAAGERPAAPLGDGQDGTFSLDVGDIHTGELSIGGGFRTVEDIDKKLADLQPDKAKEEIAPLYESLQALRKKAERYELMLRHGVSSLTPPQLDEFRVLRDELRAEADLIVKSIDVAHAKIDIDVATGRVDVGAEAIRIAGVSLPGKGIDIDEVIARGLGVGALPAGGLLKWNDWKKNLRDADGKVDELQVSGVRSKYHGLLFEKATLTGAYAKMKDRGDLLQVGLKKLSVEGIGITPRIGLLNQRLAGLKEKTRIADDKDKAKLDTEITKLSGKIADLQALADARISAYRALEAAKTPKEIDDAKRAVAESDIAIAIGLAQYGASSAELDDFGLRATGAGDVLSDALGSGLDVDRILKRGVRVQGTGPDNRVLRRLKVSGGNAKQDKTDSSYVGKGDFELGETKLNLHAQRVGDSAFIDLDQFQIASFTMSQMLLTADEGGIGLQVGSSGMSSIEDVRLSGKVRLDKRADTAGTFPQDFRFAHANVTDLRIGAIRANGLTYSSIPDAIQVTIKSGSVEGIWAKELSIDFAEKDGKASILGSAGIDAITDVDVAAALTDGIVRQANGKISGKDLKVSLLKEGETEVSIGDLNAAAFSLRGPDGWARFSLNHLSGKIGVKGGNYTLKDVRLGSFEVRAIDWRIGAKGRVQADKPASLVNLRVTAEIETEQVPDPKVTAKPGAPPATKTKVKRVHITRFHIDTIQAQHLIYQDDDVKVELKEAEYGKDPSTMGGFRPLYLENLDIVDLEWTPGQGVTRGDVDLAKFDAAVNFEDLKTGLKAGLGFKGKGIGTTFIGPDMRAMSLDAITETGGYVKSKALDTTFRTGQIVGAVTFGKDYAELENLIVDKLHFNKTTYASDDGKTIELRSADVRRITLDKVRANFETVKDDDGKDKQQVKDIELENLELTGIEAGEFEYHGKSKITNAAGESGEATQTVKASGATIDRLLISKMTRNQADKLTKLSFKVENREEKKPAFGITGLSADLVQTFGTKSTMTSFSSDVDGDAIYGNDIEFQTVSLGKVKQADGSYAPVERTKVTGKFTLNRIGLIGPDLTLTDENGQSTKIGADFSDGSWGRIDISNMQPEFFPNGTAVVPIQSILAQKMMVTRGGTKVIIPLAELRDFAVGLKGMGTDRGVELLVARARKLLFAKGLEVIVSVDRSAKSAAKGATKPGPNFIATPIGGLHGQLDAEYSLDWLPDPWIHLPIADGQLDFSSAHPFALNLEKSSDAGKMKLTLGSFHPTKDLKTLPDVGGMHPEAGGQGVINFKEMTEKLLTDTGKAQDESSEPPADLSGLNDVTVGGHLALGEGRMGYDVNGDGELGDGDNYIELSAGDAKDNTLTIPSQAVGKELRIDMPRVHAKGAQFAEGKGTTGDISFADLTITVSGLARLRFEIHVTMKKGEIDDIQFGDVTFLDASKLDTTNSIDTSKVKALPTPGLKDVNPAGEEGKP